MRVALVAAVARNGVIGRGGGLPWRIADDLRFFRATTLGKPVIMGRKTYRSIGRALPGRRNIVITRDPAFRAEGVESAPSLDAALALAAEGAAAEEACVIGGGEIYRLALDRADRIYLTRVEADVAGDVKFPAFVQGEWRETEAGRVEPSARNEFGARFCVLDRIK